MNLRGTAIKRLGAVLGESRTRRLRGAASKNLKLLAAKVAPGGVEKAAPSGPELVVPSGSVSKPAPTSSPHTKPFAPKVAPAVMGEPNDRRGGWIPSDPFLPFPPAPMSRHDLLKGLHQQVQPRTYLEIGVSNGQSLALSRAKSVGIDPQFQVDRPLRCDLDLVREKSDVFFARAAPLNHLEGAALDFAFIDGMHLSEFALRDFMNVERFMDRAGIVLLDDVLPRNPLEAARSRLTSAWTGDVYKSLEVLGRRRPDLLVLLVNTHPTGTAMVVGADPNSNVLWESYDAELAYLTKADPQSPPDHFMTRSLAVDPAALLQSDAWELLAEARRSGDYTLVAAAQEALREVPLTGAPGLSSTDAPVAPDAANKT